MPVSPYFVFGTALLLSCSFCRLIISLQRLLNQPHPDSLCGYLYPANRPVHYCPHILDVRLKPPFRDARNLSAYAAKVFRLAAPDYASSKNRLLARIKTNS
jgi:hypothetical protein